MTPNFALSLSLDGIALLQRVPDGWHLVGEVPLDAPDLNAALADLRAKGLALEPEGLRTKLVIPADQIRYMTLNGDRTTDADVRQALDGATPYAIDDLVIDAVRADGKTVVAAVARETLEEAEAFANEHRFNPVAYVAQPEAGTSGPEVFFGPTRAAAGADIRRDPRPVRQTGIAAAPQPDKAKQAAPDPATVPQAESRPPAAAQDGDRSSAAASPVFASRSKVSAPTIDGVRPAPLTAPAGPMAAAAMPGGAKPASVGAGADAKSDRRVMADALAGPGIPGAGRIAATPVPPPVAEPLFSRRKEPPAPMVGKGRAASQAALRAETHSDAPVSAITAAATPLPRTAAARSTPSPAVTAPPVTRRKPRFLGLILTAVLLLVLLLVGLWASTLQPEGLAAWWRGDDEPQVAAAAPTITPAQVTTPNAPVSATSTAPVAADPAPAPSALAPQDTAVAAPPLPVVRATVGRVLSPDEADRIYAATGVYQRAPRIADTPDSAVLEDVGPIATVAAPDAVAQPELPSLATVAPDPVIAAQVTPPGPDVAFARDARGNILATAEGTVTPQGAIVIAGAPGVRPVLRPGTPRPAVAPVSPVARPEGLVPTPAPDADAEGEAAQAEPVIDTPQPATGGGAFVAGPPPIRPTLRPTDAAATSPPATEVAVITTPAPIWTGTRPRLRPDGLVVVPSPPDAAAAAIAAYTGARPVLRPAGLAPVIAEPEPEPEPVVTADINAVAAAIAAAAPASSFRNRTALAVSVAPRPAPRPRNFATVVARARQVETPPPAAAPAPTRTAAVAATPAPPTIVAPSGNVPGGVARAATMDNAMNLRQMNLVGVYGKPNARRALVRLGNGRYVKVEVGSTLDGGQVTAIGDNALNFVKRGKTYALVLPG